VLRHGSCVSCNKPCGGMNEVALQRNACKPDVARLSTTTATFTNSKRINDVIAELPFIRCILLVTLTVCAVGSTGCHLTQPRDGWTVGNESCDVVPTSPLIPRELDKVTTPMYRIEPPDMLVIDVQQNVSQQSHPLQVGDIVSMNVSGTFPEEPISGQYQVGLGGEIDLGYSYGTVQVTGNTVGVAIELVENHLRAQLQKPIASISLTEVAGVQRIAGEHIVGPDGTVTLGQYGSVRLAGLTLEEAQAAIASDLSDDFADPKVSVSVYAYNSKAIYVVTQGGGLGDGLVRLPYTGNETVMDALSQINGLSYVSSSRMWVARPNRDSCNSLTLPIDWEAITQQADVTTNYQLLPGDRVFIAHDRLVAFDTMIAKLTSPLERILGFTLLGTGTTARLHGKVLEKTNVGIGFSP
jgi:polysaccharide export outer membrane protein